MVKSPTPTAGRSRRGTKKEIVFEYFAPEAKRVSLAGSFNNWDPEGTLLKRDRGGSWRLAVKLSPGRYEYRYVVDGSWCNDQRPVRCVPNSFGDYNCVIEVSKES